MRWKRNAWNCNEKVCWLMWDSKCYTEPDVPPVPPCDNPMIKHNKYLYEVKTPSDVIYDYANAKDYFDEYFKPSAWGCSSFVTWNIYARNLDWTYDDSIQFVYRTEARTGRFASISVVDSDSHITEKNVDICGSGGYYDILPFKCTDWINEHWVFCNINVVPWNETWWIPTTWTNPAWEDMCMLMICRWVLDNCSSAKEAVVGLSNFNIYAPALEDLPYEFHFMIGDAEDVYIVDFINNSIEVTYVQEWLGQLPPIMTNFRNANTTLDVSGHIDYTTVSEYWQWLERYNLIADNISDIHTVADALDFMSTDLKYTNSYDLTNDWVTEFVWNWLTVEDAYENPELFDSIRATAANMYANRSRDKTSPYYWTWQTTHTAVYDIADKKLNIRNQEWNDTYTFSIPE